MPKLTTGRSLRGTTITCEAVLEREALDLGGSASSARLGRRRARWMRSLRPAQYVRAGLAGGRRGAFSYCTSTGRRRRGGLARAARRRAAAPTQRRAATPPARPRRRAHRAFTSSAGAAARRRLGQRHAGQVGVDQVLLRHALHVGGGDRQVAGRALDEAAASRPRRTARCPAPAAMPSTVCSPNTNAGRQLVLRLVELGRASIGLSRTRAISSDSTACTCARRRDRAGRRRRR